MNANRYPALLFLLLLFGELAAQPDTVRHLELAVLTDTAIHKLPPKPVVDTFYTATTHPEVRERLPFATYVITSEEILRNGYVTLADVLKYVPGIRVSQPGSAVEGETFLMRGLLGNQYVKILLNGVPLKPGAALGMPIAAQLPVRQAERIEVLFGPAAAVYGSDACAGVVNIILKETELPLFTQADLSFGRVGNNGVDLMYGGKFGRDKNIFRFTAYGSSVFRERTSVFKDSFLYNPNQYLPFGIGVEAYQKNLNFLREIGSDWTPKQSLFSHESRLFGAQMAWRGLEIGYQQMMRIDHSALGINPLAIAYGNPANAVTERIQTFTLGFHTDIRELKIQNTFSAELWSWDNNSSAHQIFETLAQARYRQQHGFGTTDTYALDTLYQRFASDDRFFYVNTGDLRLDSRFRIVLMDDKLWLDLGWLLQAYGGFVGTKYLVAPYEDPLLGELFPKASLVGPFSPARRWQFEGSLFPNLKWEKGRMTLLAGAAINGFYFKNQSLMPRYHIAPHLAWSMMLDSGLTVWSSLSTGFRQPNLWALANQFRLSPDGVTQPDASAFLNKTEQFGAAEIGLRFWKKDFRAEASGFYQRGDDMARNGYRFNIAPDVEYLGWANAPGKSLELYGLQVAVKSPPLTIKFWSKTNRKFSCDWTNELNFQLASGQEWFGYGIAARGRVRQQPSTTWQFRSTFTNRKFDLVLSAVRHSDALPSAAIYEGWLQRPGVASNGGYMTWDMIYGLHLSRHFRIYFQLYNAFNFHHAGLDATGSPDDLLWNPQPGRNWRGGIVYSLQ